MYCINCFKYVFTLYLYTISYLFLFVDTHPLYFTNEDLKLHSVKNITNLTKNIEYFYTLVMELEKLANNFPENVAQDPSLSSSLLTRFMRNFTATAKTKMNLKPLISEYFVDMRLYIKEKVKDFKSLGEQAKSRLLNAIGRKRMKRGLKFLGDVISYITDLPGPTEYDRQEHLMKDMRNVINGQNSEIKTIENEIVDGSKLIKKVVPILNNYSKDK